MSLTRNPNVESVAASYVQMLDEARGGLSGKSLVNNLTDICLKHWYGMSAKFTSDPDRMDIHDDQTHDKFKIIKMTPGADVRDGVYKELISTSQNIADQLNKAFDSEVFEARMSRKGGNLEILVGFVKHSGGVFQVKAEASNAGSVIHMTMPNEAELVRAFSKMTDTPHPDDEPADGLEGDGNDDLGQIAGDEVAPEGEDNPATDPSELQDIPDEGQDHVEDDFEEEPQVRREGYMNEKYWKVKAVNHRFGSIAKTSFEAGSKREARGIAKSWLAEINSGKASYRKLSIDNLSQLMESASLNENREYTDADRKALMKSLEKFWNKVETYVKDTGFIKETYGDFGNIRMYILEFNNTHDRYRAVKKLEQMGQDIDDELDEVMGEFGRAEYDSNFSSSHTQFEGQMKASLALRDADGFVEYIFLMKSVSARRIRVSIYKKSELQQIVKKATNPQKLLRDPVAPEDDESFVVDNISVNNPDGVIAAMSTTAASDIEKIVHESKVDVKKIQPKDNDGEELDQEDEEDEELEEEAAANSVSAGGIAMPSDAGTVPRKTVRRRKKKKKKVYEGNLFQSGDHGDSVFAALELMRENHRDVFKVEYPDERDGHMKSTTFDNENEMRRFLKTTKGAIEVTQDGDK